MTGTITDGRPHVNLLIKGGGKQALAEFTVDTGYSDTLALPLADCVALDLRETGIRDSFLADGSIIGLKMYELTLVWDGKVCEFEILAIGAERLLGAQVLKGYELCLNYDTNLLTIKKPS